MSTSPAPTRVTVDYCRISRARNGLTVGVESQHDDHLDYAEEIDTVISETFTDNDISAHDGSERPDYQRMLKGMASGHIGQIIVWHADRLHRSTEELPAFIRLARKHGVRLHSKAHGEYRLNTAAGRRALRDDTSGAQYESEHKGERVSLARKRQARQGAFGGGVRPFGWGAPTNRVRSICLNPKDEPAARVYEDRPVLDMTRHNDAEAALIRQWAEDLLAGVSMAYVLRSLADVPTSTGGAWSSRTIRQILENPRTSGHSVRGGEIVKRDAFPAIIPDDKREALITMLADPARRTSPGNVPKWLGSLIYRCGVCDDGSTMSVRRNARGEPIYRCRVRGHNSRLAGPVDEFVRRVVVARLSRDDVADLLPQRASVDAVALREEIRALDLRKTEATLMWSGGKIDAERLETATADLDRQIRAIRARLTTAAGTSPLTPFVGADDAEAVWDGLSLGRRREVLRELGAPTLFPQTGRQGTEWFETGPITFPDSWVTAD